MHKNVVLRGGTHAGMYRLMSELTDWQSCAKSCCFTSFCNVGYFVPHQGCYLVTCHSQELCQSVVAEKGVEFESYVVYLRDAGDLFTEVCMFSKLRGDGICFSALIDRMGE